MDPPKVVTRADYRQDRVGFTDEGWRHVVVDIGPQVSGNSSAEIAFRLYSPNGNDPSNQVIEIHSYVDDVHLFGASVVNGGFEVNSSWTTRSSGTWSTGRYIEVVRIRKDPIKNQRWY